ncbi:FeGP cofactor biosynthesis guanylyltransferase HcgB family protein [Methanothermococcus thermolithotrophicus]|uniref:FeGP cofactor biosynthesis guanylyltransferase HcgB family protein n=1 Tax=Methanothermococcus thermolithotrophicus TaxID=2186 RepID=UPI0003683DB8|nr:FeGP cofactor biosynthesis guanylyltransferase HcgB family protein [Methanothermococcus thermolithotrophicus]
MKNYDIKNLDFQESIKTAYLESLNRTRKGDKPEEVELIKKKILESKNIVIATNNPKKFKVVKNIISKIVNADIKMIEISTDVADLTRTPAINKGLIAVDSKDADIVIARGRLGVPGSGSMLVIMDNKGRILTGSLSPSSVIHKEDIEQRIKNELIEALNRVGITVKG